MVAAAWWLRAPEVLAECFRRGADPGVFTWYRFACGWLGLDSGDASLVRRFCEVYPEGSVDSPGSDGQVRVKCHVRAHDELHVAAIAFDDPEPLDSFAFCRHMFPDRAYAEGPAAAEGWRTIMSQDRPERPLVALCENFALVDRQQAWQPFIANYAVNRVLRLQRDMMFFHAAS